MTRASPPLVFRIERVAGACRASTVRRAYIEMS
jgi:hypothetical protein